MLSLSIPGISVTVVSEGMPCGMLSLPTPGISVTVVSEGMPCGMLSDMAACGMNDIGRAPVAKTTVPPMPPKADSSASEKNKFLFFIN